LRGRYVLKEIRAAMEAAGELEVCILFSLFFLLQVDVNYVIVNVQAEGVDEESEEEEEEEVPVEPSSSRKDKGKAKALPGPEDWVPEEGTYDEEEDEEEDEDDDEDEDEDEEELLDEDEFAKWQALVPFEPVTSLAEFVEVEGKTLKSGPQGSRPLRSPRLRTLVLNPISWRTKTRRTIEVQLSTSWASLVRRRRGNLLLMCCNKLQHMH